MTRKAIAFILVIIFSLSVVSVLVLIMVSQSNIRDLKILLVTGEGLQETYGFYNGSYITNGYNYHRDNSWTESTDKWLVSTSYARISTDPLKKVHGDYSVLFNFNARYDSYYFLHRASSYGYLAMQGDKWLYFSIMFNSTAQINEFEVRVANYLGTRYFFTKHSNISSYEPNEWIRFKIHMNNMENLNASSWNDIRRLQFNVQQVAQAPLKVWIDDIMMTSSYYYNLALKNLRTMFKGIDLEVKDFGKLPSNIDDYAAVLYFDNRINSTGISVVDQYVNRGGGLILMGLSTLWQSDGTERVDFALGSSPVSILNSTETFIDNADKVDWLANHSALKPWNNYTIFEQRGYAAIRPVPFLGIAEIYNVSLRDGATSIISESGYIYEATRQYGAGKVIYFAENLAKRIANGALEAYNLRHGGFGFDGWGGATADRLQLLESAVNHVSRYPLPKVLMVPFAKKGGFVFSVETMASIDLYWYLNESCTNTLGLYSNDTAFWYIIERMKAQSEETGVVFTLLIATEQLVNESRPGHDEIEFDPKNVDALLTAYQSPNMEIALSASNILTWRENATSIEGSYQNLMQGVLDLRMALNLSDYYPLFWRYPGLFRRGESMYGAAMAGLYVDITDERGSIVFPYLMEANTWKLQNEGSFVQRIERGEWYRKLEETLFDWCIENDMLYVGSTTDQIIAADPSHIHQKDPNATVYQALWNQTPTFLNHVSNQSEKTWIVGGVTLAQYFKNWSATQASTTYDSKFNTYTFTLANASEGLTIRLPLDGKHVSSIEADTEYILKEQGNFAYLALLSPKVSETIKVTLESTKHRETAQLILINMFVANTPVWSVVKQDASNLKPLLHFNKNKQSNKNKAE